jgi:cytochrome c-type biogenesis protein CcmH
MNATVFWVVAVAMVALATIAIGVPLLWARGDGVTALSRGRALGLALRVALGIPLTALGAYALLGSPASIERASPGPSLAADTDAPHPGAEARPGPGAAGSLDESIARLEQRLEREGGDRGAWELLAQSYEYQGREADAQRARQRAVQGAGGTAVRDVPAPPAPGAADAPALADAAESARRARDYPRAIAAFEGLVARNAMTADLWADYADAVGASRGRLDESSQRLIERALALEPAHPKALWLLGSLQVERGDYRSALGTWQRLRDALPPDSPDTGLIDENIAEARARSDETAAMPGLVAAAASLPATSKPATPVTAARSPFVLRGEVALDPRAAAALTPAAVLYVFARAAGQPGPPLAAWRTTAQRWPVTFALDDSMSMLPGRKLSDSGSVTVEARLSRDGSANPSPGDPRGATLALDPRAAGPLRIVLSAGSGS